LKSCIFALPISCGMKNERKPGRDAGSPNMENRTMSDIEFWDDVKRSVEPWFDGHDMARVHLIAERFATRPPDFMTREQWEARNRFAIDKPWFPNREEKVA
jgi:hypothetical protein